MISGIFTAFSAGKKFFSKIGLGHVLNIANTHICAKKLMMKLRENAKKPVFPAYFRHFHPENFFFRKSGFATFWALTFCIFVPKIRKKLMSQSREKLVTDGRTDGRTNGRTNGRTKVNLKDLRGRSKNLTIWI